MVKPLSSRGSLRPIGRIHRYHAVGGANGTTMVVMFVGLLCWGRRYFPYFSYCRNPMARECFVPAGTLIAVKLLSLLVLSLVLCVLFIVSHFEVSRQCTHSYNIHGSGISWISRFCSASMALFLVLKTGTNWNFRRNCDRDRGKCCRATPSRP